MSELLALAFEGQECSPVWLDALAGGLAFALAVVEPSHAVGDHAVLGELMPMLSLDDPIRPMPGYRAPPLPESDAVLVFSWVQLF